MLLNAENEREWAHLLLEMAKMAATLVATFVQLLSFLSPLCPLSSLLLISQFLRWTSWEGNGYAGFLWVFWLIPGCSFSAGTMTIARIILVSVYATLLFSPSLCVLFFALDLCSVLLFFFFCFFLLSFSLGQYWWGKAYFRYGSSWDKPESSSGFFVFLFFSIFSVSPSNQPLFFWCSSVYIEPCGLVTGGMLRVDHH